MARVIACNTILYHMHNPFSCYSKIKWSINEQPKYMYLQYIILATVMSNGTTSSPLIARGTVRKT